MEKLTERQAQAECDIVRLEEELAKLKTAGPPGPPGTAASSELEQLRAENDRLRQRLSQGCDCLDI